MFEVWIMVIWIGGIGVFPEQMPYTYASKAACIEAAEEMLTVGSGDNLYWTCVKGPRR